jgi:hypothetical protein
MPINTNFWTSWLPYPSMQSTQDKGNDVAVAEGLDMHPPLTFIPLSQCKALFEPTLHGLEAEAVDADPDAATMWVAPRLHLLME